MRDLTAEEQRVLNLLGEAFNAHQQLPEVHPWDSRELMHAIHAAQNIVLARPATETQRPDAAASGQADDKEAMRLAIARDLFPSRRITPEVGDGQRTGLWS